jgi:hypothetical protein
MGTPIIRNKTDIDCFCGPACLVMPVTNHLLATIFLRSPSELLQLYFGVKMVV